MAVQPVFTSGAAPFIGAAALPIASPASPAPAAAGVLAGLAALGAKRAGHAGTRPAMTAPGARSRAAADAGDTLSPVPPVPLVSLPAGSPALAACRGEQGRVYVAIDSEFSPDKDAELTARLITLGAARAGWRGAAATAPRGGVLARYAAGKLDQVLVDSAHFRGLAANAVEVRGDPARFPLFIDAQQGRVVIDLQRAFSKGDRLSAGARRGLSLALALDAAPASVAGDPRPIRHRGQTHLEYEYVGKEIASRTGGADFYLPNSHGLISGQQPWVARHRHSYTHVNYLAGAAGANVARKEIVVHRGLIDNHRGIPENSIAAIDNAYANHYHSIEIDVQVTADEVPVLMHDFTAGRMTADRDNRLVSHTTSRELLARPLVIRHPASGDYVVTGHKVPSAEQALEHVLKTKPGMTVFLDCKESVPEAMIAMLIERPEFRPFTAIKLYGRTYTGGYPQLLDKLQQRYGIDPTAPEHRGRRARLASALAEIGLVPILSQEILTSPALARFFPAGAAGRQGGATALAETGMAWLKSWAAMKPVVLEVVQTGAGSPEGDAMRLIRERLRAPSDSYRGIPFSGSYRYEDFSVPQKDGSSKFYTWDVHGGITDVTDVKFADKRGTAGAFRAEADNILTDQPDEEVWAIGHDQTLARGHTGYKLAVAPGTHIDLRRNAENRDMRVAQFLIEKPALDEHGIRAARRGMLADRQAASGSG